ncbi:TonB-dependent receptor [Sphingomonas sp. 28-63-12]|uniref:TonB-dependent receptor n=1 Tax=Sphingomonas sp. 28-63-12 TaxID=1970434 RepID=UPI0035A87F65
MGSKLHLLGAVAAIALNAGTAMAQSAPTDPPAPQTDSDSDIVVTASRREVKLQDLAQSVTAISADTLYERGARSKEDIVYATPGLSYTDIGGGRQNFVVRGISANSGLPVTAFYIDETPVQQLGSYNYDLRLFDVDRVEVLRGPQGTLYGTSSMGGTIRTITARPEFNKLGAVFESKVSGTSHGGVNYDVNLAVNIPLVDDRLALRVVAYKEHVTGFVDNYQLLKDAAGNFSLGDRIAKNVGDRDIYGGRAALRWAPSDRLTVTGTYYLQDSSFDGVTSEDVDPDIGLVARGLRQARTFNEGPAYRAQQGNLTINYDFGWSSLISSTSYAWADGIDSVDFTRQLFGTLQFFNASEADGGAGLGDGRVLTNVTSVPLRQDSNEYSFTQEVRLASSGDGPIGWIIGGFYNKGKISALQLLGAPNIAQYLGPLAPADNLFSYDAFNKQEEYSFFGELSWKVTDRLQLTGGLRRYDIRREFGSLTKGLFNLQNSFDDVFIGTTDAGISTKTGITYRGLISWKATDDVLLYGTVSTGYRPGGPNAAIPGQPTPPAYAPDRVQQFELGWKTAWFDNHLILNGAAYYIKWPNVQVPIGTPDGNFSYTANVGQAHTEGLELEMQARPFKGFDLTSSIGIQRAVFDRAEPLLDVDKGDPLPNIPRFTANVQANYEWQLSGGWTGFAQATYSHVGRRVTNANQGIELGAYDLGGLRAGVRINRAEIAVFVNNLTDERAELGRETRGIDRLLYNPPRTVGLAFKGKF